MKRDFCLFFVFLLHAIHSSPKCSLDAQWDSGTDALNEVASFHTTANWFIPLHRARGFPEHGFFMLESWAFMSFGISSRLSTPPTWRGGTVCRWDDSFLTPVCCVLVQRREGLRGRKQFCYNQQHVRNFISRKQVFRIISKHWLQFIVCLHRLILY
jgi:hypothetical protein